MPFERPSLEDLIALSQATLSAKLGTSSPLLARTPEFALCHANAALADGNHAHADYLSRQIFPRTCDEAFLPLHAAAEGVPRKEAEASEAWRRRICAARRNRVRGGGADFVRWALEVNGVGRAWVRGCWQGIGTVGVFFANEGDYDQGRTQELRELVQTKLDANPPFGVVKNAVVPKAHPIDLVIPLAPNIEAVRESVRVRVAEWLRDFELGPARLLLSQLRGVISSADGVVDHRVHLPWSDIDLGVGELPTLGAVEFKDLKGQ